MASHYQLQLGELVGGKLRFENEASGFLQSLRDGFFFLKAPADCDLGATDTFARNFFKDKGGGELEEYRGFKQYTAERLGAKHEGYYLRDCDQTEQFFLERRFWSSIYPPGVVQAAESLKSLSVSVLTEVLAKLGIPRELWAAATGGCSSHEGMYHLTFNHFRSEKNARGLNIHKDSGWVTILRSTDPGLEAFIGGSWVPINPLPGYFIVNFGCAMEILTRESSPVVSAVTHRVVQQTTRALGGNNRVSYALFADSPLDKAKYEGLYVYRPEGGLKLEMDFASFLDKIVTSTYEESSVGLY